MRQETNPQSAEISLGLNRIVPWSHTLVTEVLEPGDTVVDLTAGHGRDTLVLALAVGLTGRVVAFDVQKSALEQAARTLRVAGFPVTDWKLGADVPTAPGIYLVHACHTTLAAFVTTPIRAAIANLGYLSVGDVSLTTHPVTTCRALRAALDLLLPGGRLVVTVYPGHPGGDAEADAVNVLLTGLPCKQWHVLRLSVANVAGAPYLLLAERTDR